MMVSAICPIYNEEKYIGRFLDSILNQDYPKTELEILLVDGMSKDKTRDIIKTYSAIYPCLKLIDNPHMTAPYAMNAGIEQAKGDIIIRLDVHAEYPKDYLAKLTDNLRKLEGAENVGGVCVTLPGSHSATAIAIAACMSNPFGMGNSSFRIGTDKIKCVDTVPFGCFRKSLFSRIGLYDTDMTRNQDDELNGRIIKNGGKIFLLPDVVIKYYAREKVSKVRKMFFQYGLYKPLVNKKVGTPVSKRQFIPVLFVLGLVLGLVFSFVFPVLRPLYIGVICLYVLIGFVEGIMSVTKNRSMASALLMPYVFLNIHLSYGLGYLTGLYNILLRQDFHASLSR